MSSAGHQPEQDPDEHSIALLIERGDDLTKPLIASYWLMLNSEAASQIAENSLKRAGFEVRVGKYPDCHIWKCDATMKLIPELPILRKNRLLLTSLAQSLNGEYLGLSAYRHYEAPVVNESEYRLACSQVVTTAQGIINGEIGIVEGARRLKYLRTNARATDDPDFQFLVGVESKTQHLPLGAVRRHWNANALKLKDIELQNIETAAKDEMFEVCRILIAKYEKLST